MPGPNRGRQFGGQKIEHPFPVLKRVLGYMMRDYAPRFVIVVICILLSAYCSIRGTLFLRTLIDDYITPMTQQANPDFGPLAAAIGKMAGIYAIGIASSYCYNRLMVNISQGTMLRLRKELIRQTSCAENNILIFALRGAIIDTNSYRYISYRMAEMDD